MISSSEGYRGRSTGSLVRVEPVHWDGHGRVAVIGEVDLSNVRDVEAALSYLAVSAALTLANPQNLMRRAIEITHLEDAVAVIHDV